MFLKRKNSFDYNMSSFVVTSMKNHDIFPILLKNGELWFIIELDNIQTSFVPTFHDISCDKKYKKYIHGSDDNKIIDFVFGESYLLTLFENGNVYFEGKLCFEGEQSFFSSDKPVMIAEKIIQIAGFCHSKNQIGKYQDNIFLLRSDMKILTFLQQNDNNILSLQEDTRIGDKNIIFVFCESEYIFYYSDSNDLFFFGDNTDRIISIDDDVIKNPTFVTNISDIKYFCMINSSLLVIQNNNDIHIIGEDKQFDNYVRTIGFIINWCLDNYCENQIEKIYFREQCEYTKNNDKQVIINLNNIEKYFFECKKKQNKQIEYIYFSVDDEGIHNIFFYYDGYLFDINIFDLYSVKIKKCDIFTYPFCMSNNDCEYNKYLKQFKFDNYEEKISKNINIVKMENFVIPKTTWSSNKHCFFPDYLRKCIYSFLLVNLRITKNKKNLKIPKFILFKIFNCLVF